MRQPRLVASLTHWIDDWAVAERAKEKAAFTASYEQKLLAQRNKLDAQLAATLDWLGPPERIESGWWDGAPMRRDYHQARARDGSRLWVFREHAAPGGWFVHGLYA